MLNENAKKWVAALRSEKYKQCKNRLSHAGRFCCLGVACDISGAPRKEWGTLQALPYSVQQWLGLRTSEGDFGEPGGLSNRLSALNDYEEKTFAQIADVIKSEPKGLFVGGVK